MLTECLAPPCFHPRRRIIQSMHHKLTFLRNPRHPLPPAVKTLMELRPDANRWVGPRTTVSSSRAAGARHAICCERRTALGALVAGFPLSGAGRTALCAPLRPVHVHPLVYHSCTPPRLVVSHAALTASWLPSAACVAPPPPPGCGCEAAPQGRQSVAARPRVCGGAGRGHLHKLRCGGGVEGWGAGEDGGGTCAGIRNRRRPLAG